MTPWVALKWLWLLLAAFTLFTVPVLACLMWCLGLKPKVIRFHVGPPLLAFQALGIRWSFGLLFFGGAVSSRLPEDEPAQPNQQEPDYAQLSFPLRLLYIAGPVLSSGLLVLLTLPVSRGLASVASGFEQTVNFFAASERVRAFFALLKVEGFWVALGVLSAKSTALALLPLPPFGGFMLLRELWMTLLQRPSRASLFMPERLAVLLVLALWIGWPLCLLWGLFTLPR